MTWQPIDFQRIVTLDEGLVDQLQRYLILKEVEFVDTILNAVPFISASQPSLSPSSVANFKLVDAVDTFGKKTTQWLTSTHEPINADTWKSIAKEINTAFWEYFEVLEGGIKELFLQLEQLGIEQWGEEISNVMKLLKDLLLKKIEDLILAAKRMEQRLTEFRLICETRNSRYPFLYRFIHFWTPALDHSLLINLQKSEKFLLDNYQRFHNRFEEYGALDEKVSNKMKKMDHYQILYTLDDEARNKYSKIYYYLKLWSLDQKFKTLPQTDLVRAVQHITTTTERAIEIFRKYASSIRTALFHQSRLLKKTSNKELKDPVAKKAILELIKGYRSELFSLGSTVARYRDFLLRTDSNPYVSSRWGFTEWVVGPEPDQTRQLMDIEYELEYLGALFGSLEESLQTPPKRRWSHPIQIDSSIQRAIYEMGQPLTSYNIAKSRAEKIMKHLQELDELGALDRLAVDYAEQLIGKVLRADWKYHLLHEMPLYQELIAIHLGIMGAIDERKHINRISKFKHLIHEIETWVKHRETRKHERDIELDLNDLKGYLQDFFAQVQRTSKDETLDAKAAHNLIVILSYQLLIYRNMFGQFFCNLRRFGGEEASLIRNKLLFVDQYFESTDNKLEELRLHNWPKKIEDNA